MNREIKFRAWSIIGRRMYNWEEMHAYPAHKLSQYFRHYDMYELMQYTGLKDKNGKECYWDDWVTDGINPKFLVTSDYHLLARLSEIEFEIVENKYEA